MYRDRPLECPLNFALPVIVVWQPQQGDAINSGVRFARGDFHPVEFHQIRIQLIGDLPDFRFDCRVEFFTVVEQRSILFFGRSDVTGF